MKLVFIGASYATVYLMYVKFKATYDHNHDTFRIEFLLIPTFVLALLLNHEFTVMEVSELLLNNAQSGRYACHAYRRIFEVNCLLAHAPTHIDMMMMIKNLCWATDSSRVEGEYVKKNVSVYSNYIRLKAIPTNFISLIKKLNVTLL